MLAKAQASALANAEQLNSSPSPTTILKTVNSSGTYMCSTTRSSIDNPSPVVIYHSESPTTTTTSILTQMPQQTNNMMQHRNTNNNHHTQFLDENDENQFQYHNRYNYSQSQHPQHQVISETQQQADQHSIELRMNNLGNERQDGD
jgi:cryptochrome